MGLSDGNIGVEKDIVDPNLRALAFELKNPLVNIARQAELASSGSYQEIQHTAEQALKLIDSYLLHAQSEYGQTMLDLTPANIGSILYDASIQLSGVAAKRNTSLIIDDQTSEPVMTHRSALTSVLTAFGDTLIGQNDKKLYQEVILRGYKTRSGKLGIGLFTETKITKDDLRLALDLRGRAHMPLARVSTSGQISLLIADGLCRAIGGSMIVKKMGRYSGLATELPRSEQLAFV